MKGLQFLGYINQIILSKLANSGKAVIQSLVNQHSRFYFDMSGCSVISLQGEIELIFSE